jgi:hypothetical protein
MREDLRYRTALLDWLACAIGGRSERAARAAAAVGDDVAALATAGHVLDFDDTYPPGLAHLSAPTAPAALGTEAVSDDTENRAPSASPADDDIVPEPAEAGATAGASQEEA